MPFSFELSDRQSARVIEQVIRAGTPMRLDPHYSSGGDALSAQLIEENPQRLTFRFAGSQETIAAQFVPGQYCQVQFSTNGAVYMISVHVLDMDVPQGRLYTSRPNLVQLLERRKFARTQLAGHTPVTVHWLDEDHQVESSLFNIAGGGLAFRIAKEIADSIHVGDAMAVSFELPGLARRFQFQISICNKTVASDQVSVIVGAQFQETTEAAQAGPLDELRRFLATQQQANITR